jgi:hypothetical protein
MLSPYSQAQFIEKTITSQTGERFRVTFLVALVDGKMSAKIVSAVAIDAAPIVSSASSARAAVLSLAAPVEKQPVAFTYKPSFAAKISPYFSLDFFVSQPTRAPSFN